MKKYLLVAFSLALQPVGLLAQDLLLEKLLENDDENASESALLELEENPLDLQKVSREDLLRLPFLSASQINSFLQAREVRGRWANANEALSALAVSGDTLAFCRRIFELVPQKTTALKVNSRLRVVHPASRDDDWQGAAYRNYETVRATIGGFSAAALAERDPGEKRFDDLRLFAFSLPVEFNALRMELLAGDFFIEWGQGLTLWGPYGQSIGSSASAPVRRQARGLRPYLSADEDFAFHGAALSLKSSHVGLQVFASRARLDAAPRDSATISLSDTGGLHRTTGEQEKKDRAAENSRGVSVYFSGNNPKGDFSWRTGVLLHQQKFDRLVQPASHPSNYFDFRGDQNRLLSFFGECTLKKYLLAGEWAINDKAGRAYQITFETESRPIALAGAVWSYAADFHSSRGRAFGAFNSAPQNQQGKYLGLRLLLNRHLNIESYFQLRHFPWRTYALPLPTMKRDFGVTIEWKNATWHLRVRLRQRLQEQSAASVNNAGNPILTPQESRGLLLEIRQELSPKVQLATRLDLRRQNPLVDGETVASLTSPQQGFAISQEFGWRLRHNLQLFARLTIFETPFHEAIYLYERDLPGLITNFALREQGQRGYIFCTIEPLAGLQLSAKASQMWRMANPSRAGDGLAWGVQADWQFRRPAKDKLRTGRTKGGR